MNRILTLLAVLPFAAPAFAATAAPTPPANPASRNFAATIPATGLTRVSLGATVGQVNVRAGAGNAVKVRVHARPGSHGHFIFDWTFGPSGNKLPADLHLVARRENGTLLLCLASRRTNGCNSNIKTPSAKTQSGESGETYIAVNPLSGQVVEGGWKSQWTVTLPARLALKLELDVGKAEIGGVGGGVNANVDVGKLDVKLPRGPLKASVDVGGVDAEVGSADYGLVDLSADIGHVAFDVNGNRITTGFKHETTGASQRLTGPGTTAYTLQSNVGSVTLKLGVRGLPSLPSIAASAPGATSASAPASRAQAPVSASATAAQTGIAPAATRAH